MVVPSGDMISGLIFDLVVICVMDLMDFQNSQGWCCLRF